MPYRADKSICRILSNTAIALLILATGSFAQPSHAASGDQIAKLTPDDAAAFDFFGSSVGISGHTAVVGNQKDQFVGAFSGAAYLFDVSTGVQLRKLTTDDSFDQFARAVGISGNTVIVGAPADDEAGDAAGAAYLFDAVTGNQLVKFTPANEFDLFGISVAISQTIAVVGSARNSNSDDNSGAVYLLDVTTRDQVGKFTTDTILDGFGGSVGISGNTVIVGASDDDEMGNDSGAAYLFDAVTGNQLAKLTADDAAPGDHFGESVAISGNTAIVGAVTSPLETQNQRGAAYLFDVTTGTQLAKLFADDHVSGDRFGANVALDGHIAIVAASHDTEAGEFSGAVYLFDTSTGNQMAKLTADNAAGGDFFGGSVAISANRILVGAHGDDVLGGFTGAAYLFDTAIPEPTTLSLLSLICPICLRYGLRLHLY